MHLSAQYFEKSSFSVWHNHYFSVKDKSKNDGSSNLDVLMLGVLVGINDKRGGNEEPKRWATEEQVEAGEGRWRKTGRR